MSNPTASVENLTARLDAVRSSIRRLLLVQGVAFVLLYLCVFCLASFLLDFVAELPRFVRLLLLGAGLGGLAYLALRDFVRPLLLPLRHDDLALAVERRFPALEERLISAIQLAREKTRYPTFNSPELIDRLIAETQEVSAGITFGQIISQQRVIQWLGGAAAAVLLVVLVAVEWPAYSRAWFARLFGANAPWPRKTDLVLLEPTDNPSMIARGSDLVVVCEAQRRKPKKVTLSILPTEGSGEPTQRTLRPGKDDRFRYVFARVTEGFRFHLAGNDARLPERENQWIEVVVLTPPAIERIQLWYDFPAYTGMADTDPGVPQEGGNIKAPIGTSVRVRALANIPLSEATLQIGRGEVTQSSSMKISSDSTGTTRLLDGALGVEGDSEYVIMLRAENGLRSHDPVRYSIRAVLDTAPVVKILEPGMDKSVTPRARVPLVALTTDDYGISNIQLLFKTTGEKPEESSLPLESFHDAPYGQRRIQTEYPFEISSFGLKEGDTLSYSLLAADNCAMPKPNETRSRTFVFTIISPEQFQKRVDDLLVKLKEEIRRQFKFQEGLKRDTETVRTELSEAERLSDAERHSVLGLSTSQRQLGQAVERVTRELREIARDLEYNRLLESGSERRFREMGQALGQIAEELSPQASQMLLEASSAPSASPRTANMDKAVLSQDAILAHLRGVLSKLEEYETYSEVLKITRELLEREEKLRDDMRKIAGEEKPR